MSGPLDGIRVLDLSRVLSGPHCGRNLADLGADVIKVEPPEGDLSRFLGPRTGSMSHYHAQQNSGKRNISLDLAHAEAQSLLLRLATTVDVLLENFRPGVLARYGLSYDAVAAVNPGIVYASITGYGQDGPWAQRRAYAVAVHAEAGLLAGLENRGVEVRNDGASHADVYAGLEATIGILAALHHRSRTGRGQHVDVDMASSLLMTNEHVAIDFVSGSKGPNAHVYSLADGRMVTFPADATAKGTFELFCKAMERPDLVTDPRFERIGDRFRNRDALYEIVQAWIQTFASADDLEEVLGRVRLPLGVVRSTVELRDTDWAAHRGAFTDVSDGAGGTITVPSPPWRFSDASSRAAVRRDPAWRGQHNREVLAELLDLTDAELDRLEADGVLSSRPPR
jgi:crotonobetainyl-CoA:carnitine CoA-transferase CaiB-like acyl-CoA transferase